MNLKKEFKQNRKLIFILSLLFIGAIVAAKSGVLPFAGAGYQELYVPTFGWYTCKEQPVEFAKQINRLIPEGGTSIRLSSLVLCDPLKLYPVGVSTNSYEWYQPTRYISYKVNGLLKKGIKIPRSAGTIPVGNFRCNDVIELEICDWSCINSVPNAGVLSIEYKPYQIYKYDIFAGGKTPVSGTVDCRITDSAYSTLLDGFSGLKGLALEGEPNLEGKRTLKPEESWNYVTTTPVQTLYNIEIYNGQEAYCRNRNMYKIGSVETKSPVTTI